MSISLVPDSDTATFPKQNPSMWLKGILGRAFVAICDGAGVALTATAGALDVNVKTTDVTQGIAGDVASGTADSGNPVKVGGIGLTDLPTAVDTGDRVGQMLDVFGRPVVLVGAPRDLVIDSTTTISSSVAETDLLAAVASTYQDVVSVVVCNTSGTDVRVDFRSAAAGSVRFSLFVPAGATVGIDKTVPITQAAVNNKWTAQCSASVADVRIYIQAIKNK